MTRKLDRALIRHGFEHRGYKVTDEQIEYYASVFKDLEDYAHGSEEMTSQGVVVLNEYIMLKIQQGLNVDWLIESLNNNGWKQTAILMNEKATVTSPWKKKALNDQTNND